MNKIKNLVLAHIEKAILLFVLIWGIVHIVGALSPADFSTKTELIKKSISKIKEKRSASKPPPLTVEKAFDRMTAPFRRIPKVDIGDYWHVYFTPNVQSDHEILVGQQMQVSLSFVNNVDSIKVLSGEDRIEVKLSEVKGKLKVKGLKKGKARVQLKDKNGSKESLVFSVTEPRKIKVKTREELIYIVHAPLSFEATAERGQVSFKANLSLEKTRAVLTGYQIYRKESGGEYEKIYLAKAKKKVISETTSTPNSKDKNTGGGVKVRSDNLPPGREKATGSKAPARKSEASTEKKKTTPDSTSATDTKEEIKGPIWAAVRLTSDDFGNPVSYVEGHDTSVKPDTTYVYAITAVGKNPKTLEILESEKVSVEVLTASNVEVFFTGTAGIANEYAMLTVRRWSSDEDFLDKHFQALVGDSIGGKKLIRGKGTVDFSTGMTLVDVILDSRVVEESERQVVLPVLDDSGKLRHVTRIFQTLKKASKIIVLDAKNRVREIVKKGVVRTRSSRAKLDGFEK